VIFKGIVENGMDAKKLETGKCSDFSKAKEVIACQSQARDCDVTLKQGS
jgi:hypothetical protein